VVAAPKGAMIFRAKGVVVGCAKMTICTRLRPCVSRCAAKGPRGSAGGRAPKASRRPSRRRPAETPRRLLLDGARPRRRRPAGRGRSRPRRGLAFAGLGFDAAAKGENCSATDRSAGEPSLKTVEAQHVPPKHVKLATWRRKHTSPTSCFETTQ
jgi:hypothetical protein